MFIKASKKDFHFPTESKNIRESPGKQILLHVICEMFSHILILVFSELVQYETNLSVKFSFRVQ